MQKYWSELLVCLTLTCFEYYLDFSIFKVNVGRVPHLLLIYRLNNFILCIKLFVTDDALLYHFKLNYLK